MTMIVGGKSDGCDCPAKVPRMDLDGEAYMLVSYRDGGKEHFFYMLADMKPADAQKKFKERLKK